MESFIICTHRQISMGRSNQTERGRRGMWHAWEKAGKCAGFGGKARRKKTTWETKA
jgi:hypothetical protein